MPRILIVLTALIVIQPLSAADRNIDFHQDVRPIFMKSCYSCHGPDKQRGGLRLDRKSDAFKGGDTGPIIVVGKSGESLLVKLIAGLEPDRPMPPKGPRLSDEQINIVRSWIDQGAKWPDDGSENTARWWSLSPLTQPALPKLSANDAKWARNPIDAFIITKLREKGLAPSPEADRRTLIRRLTFDLIGLPPTPEEVDAFVNDNSADAYEKLVDRLLRSPHYGERWARHWLDVVHYGDTHGYDKDQPRPNAWPYRDYVIRALNNDKRYSLFVEEQIAGDILFPGTMDGTTAMGFISAGPWDLIGHAEVPETKIDGKIARHLDRDDMVANTINTFVSMTVQCAQCHNHKFDPITQENYYQLHSVFAALDRADRPYHLDPKNSRKNAILQVRRTELLEKQKQLDAEVRKLAGPELVELDRRIALASKPVQPRAEFGYHSAIAPKQDVVKWVQVDLGKPTTIDAVNLFGCHDDFNNIGAGFGFPVRFKIEVSDDAMFTNSHMIIDQSIDFANPGVIQQSYKAKNVVGRFVRLTATKLAPRMNDFILAMSEIEVIDATGKNVATKAIVTSLDSIEAPTRWQKVNLTDGYAPGQSTELPRLQKERQAIVAKVTDLTTSQAISEVATELASVDRELSTVRPMGMVYAGTIHNGGGTFRGTGPDGGKPRPISILRRGDVTNPGKLVEPGTLSVLPELPGGFALSADSPEGERRAKLAKWITDRKNPLTWRSIVNRTWQYHFGRGIVATPNDFGKMGQLPTHPELLDWLASEFRDGDQSMKSLHKSIVMSSTYRQSSAGNVAFEKSDAGNVYLWHMPRRKLEAEAVRDAALMVSGKLNRTLYGPAFQDFVVEQPQHSPHYEYHLHDLNDPKAYRRSIYRFLVRSKPQPFMTALDCADPSMQVDKRIETLSPLQALALLNNGFMLSMAQHLANRVESAGAMPERITMAFRLALSRTPTDAERTALVEYAKVYGLPNACRVILNLNEFVFVD